MTVEARMTGPSSEMDGPRRAIAGMEACQTLFMEMTLDNVDFATSVASMRSPLEILSVATKFAARRIGMYGRFSKAVTDIAADAKPRSPEQSLEASVLPHTDPALRDWASSQAQPTLRRCCPTRCQDDRRTFELSARFLKLSTPDRLAFGFCRPPRQPSAAEGWLAKRRGRIPEVNLSKRRSGAVLAMRTINF